MRYRWAAAITLTAIAAALAVARADDALPDQPATADDVKKMVDDGKYRDALKELLRILTLKGPAAEGYNRYDMLMLKAESQLQIRQLPAAIATYKDARAQALADKKPDQVALPSAMAELLRRSPAYEYRPPNPDGGSPISVLDKTLRKAAFSKLLDDELPAVQRKVPLLAKVSTMEPVIDAANVVGTLRALEIAATGDTAQTGELVSDVRDQAVRLMGGAVDEMQARADIIQKHANQQITENVPQYDMVHGKSWLQQMTHLKGPTAAERQSLNDMFTTCEKIQGASRQIADALGTEFDAMSGIANKAEAVKKEAAAILRADYSQPIAK